MRGALLIAPIALLAFAPAAQADDKSDEWRTRVVADKPQLVLDPAKAYILVQTRGLQLPRFSRMAAPADEAAYAELRAAELAKEHAKWERKLAGWQRDIDALRNNPGGASRPKRPVEPTAANFAFPTYEASHSFEMGPENRFAKNGQSIYLQEVAPGDYVYQGQRMVCACLGTVSFTASAGKVVGVKLAFPYLDTFRDLPKEQRPKSVFDLAPGVSTLAISAADYSDPRIPASAIVAPDFRAAGQRPNSGGGEVDRVMPILGVMHYDRGKQIDERAASKP